MPASLDLPAELDPPVDWTLGMEGLMPGTTTLTLRLMENGAELCSDTVRVTVIGLDVAWETTGANPQPIVEPNDHPSGTLGVKFFPGATAPGGGFNDIVQVKVSTNPPVEGVSVFLKAVDPDDPSANNDVVDNNLTGTDNRDDNHHDTLELGSTQLTTDTNGERTTTFRVAHQPGDNHRVAATIKQTTQSAPTLDMPSDDNVPPSATAQNPAATQNQVELFIGNISKLLTAWRKLNVEVDSMVAEPTTVSARSPDWGNVTIETALPGQPPGRTTLNLTGNVESDESSHYEGGTLTVAGFAQPLRVISNTWNSLEIGRALTNTEKTTIEGATGLLRDDDPISGQLPSYPTFSQFLKGAYALAYLDIVQVAQNPRPTVAFNLNLTDTELQWGIGYDNSQDVDSEASFWAALLVIGYQQESIADMDGDADLGDNANPVGGNPNQDRFIEVGTTVEDSNNASVIYVEVLRDFGAQEGKDLEHTIAHEIGHSAGNNTPAAQDHAEGGIMTTGAPNDIDFFTPATLWRFRETPKW